MLEARKFELEIFNIISITFLLLIACI